MVYLIDAEELDESICMRCGSKVCYPWQEPELPFEDTEAGEQLTLESGLSVTS